MTIEICVDSQASVEACAEGGADRIELCAGLVEGGTTPSAGFLRIARRVFPGQIMMMIRPRCGDFFYSEAEAEIMREDIRTAREGGADGVVFGGLTADGRIDRALAESLLASAAGMLVTFHRAFDVTPDLEASLESLISLGIPRVLTSGGRPSAPEGLGVIRRLVDHAAGRICILPGGGIKAEMIPDIVTATGVTECHLSARHSVESPMVFRRTDIPMGALEVPGEYTAKVASSSLIRLAKQARRL